MSFMALRVKFVAFVSLITVPLFAFILYFSPSLATAQTAALSVQTEAAKTEAQLQPVSVAKQGSETNDTSKIDEPPAATDTPQDKKPEVPKAENIDLEEVIEELEESKPAPVEPGKPEPQQPGTSPVVSATPEPAAPTQPTESPAADQSSLPQGNVSKVILGVEVPPVTKTRLVWTPENKLSGLAEKTPVLIVNGANLGQTLCLTAALHGDELNGIEMIRRIMYNLEPDKLTGTVVGVPVVNLMGFRRNSRYLPDRRDLNRYFPGNRTGSSASRIAYSLFNNVIKNCDALVDIHTGSFHRTNLIQLRADLKNEKVAELAHQFGAIAVLNSRGNYNSLRAAAVRADIPTVTIEAGEPMRLQDTVVTEGVKAIRTFMTNIGMYGTKSIWFKSAPVYYKSNWVRVNQSGILFSQVSLGERVSPGELLGTVTDPITNARSEVISPYHGRVLGMALDQVVLPGFAAYHIGIQTPEEMLKEETPTAEGDNAHSDDDGDDAPSPPLPETGGNISEEILKEREELED